MIRSHVQQRHRNIQDAWQRKPRRFRVMPTDMILRGFNIYHALKEIYGPSTPGSSPLLSADGSSVLTDPDDFLKRWAEYFCIVLNRPSSISSEAISNLPQVLDNVSLTSCDGKAQGRYCIPAEIYKCGGECGCVGYQTDRTLCPYLGKASASAPQDFKDASIVHHMNKKQKAMDSLVITTDAYLFSPLLARFLQESS